MKSLRQQSGTKAHSGSFRTRKSAKKQISVPDTKLANLYSRLDQTKPGSQESKKIADEIIDAIG